ncbi:MAG TPA: excinuclease ABC subunit B, partial [Candidatus Acetothermia bacterium]|nr:excinuclease ABC subunit B [Candidatus Acetothermia bacterium]
MAKVAAGERFCIKTKLRPQGDQPKAIRELTEGVLSGLRYQTLLGATGTGKTFTISHVIQNVQKPTLVIAHNKTLTAQLYGEFRELFPDNAVHYFVSYYDYYQPEAYIPQTDTYIEKDAQINEEIDRLRHAATSSLLERRDVIIVASVSCIYGLGSPSDYAALALTLEVGKEYDLDDVLRQLVLLQYRRNELSFERATFRLRGDVLEIIPASEEVGFRIEWFGDEVERISVVDPLTGDVLAPRDYV